jgi:hypothetical protein
MAQYRYLLYDLLTNTPITELPLNGVSFTEQLNSAGTFSATLLITDANEAALSVIQGTQPARTALYVERSDLPNNVGRSLVWGGIIWGRTYNSTSQTISITAREFESYMEKVFIFPFELQGTTFGSLTQPYVYNNIDQFQMVQQLIAGLQFSVPGVGNRNIGITVPALSSGVNVSVTYTGADLKTYYQALLDLSQSNNGFDFNVDVYYDGTGTPQKVLNLGYPRIGYVYTAGDPNAPTLQLPGNILDYDYFEDGSIVANEAVAVGSNVYSLYQSEDYSAKGWPTLMASFSFPDITSQSLITALAAGRNAALAYPPTTLKVTQIASQQPTVGVVNPGDDVRVIINDARFPTGLNAVYRVTAITTTPNEAGGPEQITYSLTQPNNIYS